MLNKNAKNWIKALRSGKYLQGRDRLRAGNAFCCLGVACDLYAKEKGSGGKWENKNKHGVVNFEFSVTKKMEYADKTLPEAVRQWLGLRTEDGSFESDSVDTALGDSLVEINDDGSNFKEIADIIESEPEGLFK